ncbi:MAG: Inositol 2-dehydrogenase/D-chiro-inositol 3-dehydrogenase [Phycisphaerae bacterium]|nr:Inositol 2-dehydrogenase/D-chiro-inositol 3-dehydrogenase [Phycisphaerae bacterium]
MVRVGIVGLGFMGTAHFGYYSANPKARIVALCDRIQARREGDFSGVGGNLSASGGKGVDLSKIASYAKPEQLIADPNVDLVDICLPTDLHAKYAVLALKAGKHVINEKPMALTVADCDKVAAVAARAKGAYMVAQCIRFWPQYAVARQIVASGRLGPLKTIFLERLAPTPRYSTQQWLLNAKRSGGAAFDLHVHDVDYANYLAGVPTHVSAVGYKGESGGFDHVTATLVYPKGVVATVRGGWTYPDKWSFEMAFTIECAKGTIHWRMTSGQPMTVITNNKVETPKVASSDGWAEELKYLVNCIEKKQKPTVVTARTSRDAIRTVVAEVRSAAANGKVVTLGR